jgi:hypothetical protein
VRTINCSVPVLSSLGKLTKRFYAHSRRFGRIKIRQVGIINIKPTAAIALLTSIGIPSRARVALPATKTKAIAKRLKAALFADREILKTFAQDSHLYSVCLENMGS